jgi:hypothetical protein
MKGQRTPEERRAIGLRLKGVPADFVRPAEWPVSCEQCGAALTGVRWRYCSLRCSQKAWHAEHQDKYDAWQLKRQRADPLRFAARNAVWEAILKGEITRPAVCSECRQPSQQAIEAHHHKGYDVVNRLAVVWLCKKCHAKQHPRRKVA